MNLSMDVAPPGFGWKQAGTDPDKTPEQSHDPVPQHDTAIVTGTFARALDAPACDAHLLSQQSFPDDAFVLVDRGTCMFTDKVMNVQKAGGRAAIIIDYANSDQLHVMGSDMQGTQPDIPSGLIRAADGRQLLELMIRGQSLQGILKLGTRHNALHDQAANQLHAEQEDTGSEEYGSGYEPDAADQCVRDDDRESTEQQRQAVPLKLEILVPMQAHGWLSQHFPNAKALPGALAMLMSDVAAIGMHQQMQTPAELASDSDSSSSALHAGHDEL